MEILVHRPIFWGEVLPQYPDCADIASVSQSVFEVLSQCSIVFAGAAPVSIPMSSVPHCVQNVAFLPCPTVCAGVSSVFHCACRCYFRVLLCVQVLLQCPTLCAGVTSVSHSVCSCYISVPLNADVMSVSHSVGRCYLSVPLCVLVLSKCPTLCLCYLSVSLCAGVT